MKICAKACGNLSEYQSLCTSWLHISEAVAEKLCEPDAENSAIRMAVSEVQEEDHSLRVLTFIDTEQLKNNKQSIAEELVGFGLLLLHDAALRCLSEEALKDAQQVENFSSYLQKQLTDSWDVVMLPHLMTRH